MGVLYNLFKDQLNHFKRNLWLSSVGARVCYNQGDASDILLFDNRVNSREERANFLKKLGFQFYHTSVFAHSFEWFNIEDIPSYKDFVYRLGVPEGIAGSIINDDTNKAKFITLTVLGSRYFKSEPVLDGNVIGLSFRHFIEDADTPTSKKLLEELIEESHDPDISTFIGFDDFIEHKRKVVLLHWDFRYKGYFVFLVQDISRACSHQIVRHTKLNYSQRSQRYVRESGDDVFVYPPNIDHKAHQSFTEAYKYSKTMYDILTTQHKVKKEDARLVLPNATKTVLMISGTLKDIKDFIQKRIIHQAQWEVREVAEEMRELISTAKLIYFDTKM